MRALAGVLQSEGEGQGHGRAAEGTRIAQLAAAREGPSPARELPTARAKETASLELRPAAILYARCTPDPGGGLRAKSKTRNATLAYQSRVLSQQPRSMVLEQRLQA